MKIHAFQVLPTWAWRRRARAGIALWLSFAMAGLPASACCDDFLSCAAAVATGGLSCAVEAAIKAITNAVNALRQSRSAAVSEFNATLDPEMEACREQLAEIQTQINQLLAQIEKAGVDGGVVPAGGSDLTHPGTARIAEGSAGDATNRPTNRRQRSVSGDSVGKKHVEAHLEAELENSPSLGRLRAELAALVAKKRQVVEELKEEINTAKTLELEAAGRAKDALNDSFLSQLDRALKSLDNALGHPLDAGADVQDAITVFNAAQAGFFDVVTPALNQAVSDITGTIELPFNLLLSLEKEARRADELVAAIQKMTTVSSEPERAAIAEQLDNTPPKPSAIKLTNGRKLSSKSFEVMKRKVTKHSESAKAALDRIMVPHAPMETSIYRAKLAGDFDAHFNGVPTAVAHRKLKELIAEAKVRYAKDPATLKALEKYLRDEARARGVD